MTAQSQQHSTWWAAHSAGLTANDLWLYYFGIGGRLETFELDAYLHGLYFLPQGERNMIAAALNEMIDELPRRPKAEFVHPRD